MSKNTGIKHMGEGFEELLCELTSAKKYDSGSDPRGDAYYSYEGKEYSLEAKDNAWNQVRPDKNAIPFGRHKGKYYSACLLTVLRTIVRGGKKENGYEKKGQHTPDPFSCMSMGLPNSRKRKELGMRCFGDNITDKDIEKSNATE